MATLIFYLDDGREIPVPVDGRIKVGSTEGNDVLVEDAGVSARHAEITHTPVGGYHLRDLGSESGTKVNGERVTSRDLLHGDEISFGRLRGRFFLYDADAAPSSDEEAKLKLRELKDAYKDTFTKHTTLLGVVTSLATQERQKLASLDRLQTDTLNLETRIANARGLLHQLEDSIAKASGTSTDAAAEQRNAREETEKQIIRLEHLNQSVAKLETEKLELEQGLWELAERRKESESKRDQADAESSRTRAEHQKLSAEIVILAQKQTAILASLHEQETKTVGLTKTLDELTRHHADETEKMDRLTSDRQRLEQNVAALNTEESRSRETLAGMESQMAVLTTALRELEEKISRGEITLEGLLQKHVETKAETETLRAEKENCETAISRLGIDLTNLRSSVVDMESRQTAGLELIRLRQEQVRSANESLDEIRTAHQAEIQTQAETLSTMLDRLQASETQLQVTLAKNEVLALQNLKLDEVRGQIQNAEEKHTYLSAQNQGFEEQATRLNSNLAQRHGELESATEQLTRLRVDESALLKIIQTLQQDAHTEQQRFDQSIKTHAEINQQAEARHQELESKLEILRGQINKLEAYLTSLEVWKDDMNEHYIRLAVLPEDSPDALKLWREIHRQKDAIAAQLPAQTGIKPRFNTQVQVVPRGQRPA